MAYLANPDNPTGHVFSTAEVAPPRNPLLPNVDRGSSDVPNLDVCLGEQRSARPFHQDKRHPEPEGRFLSEASKRRRDTLQGFKDLNLKAKDTI